MRTPLVGYGAFIKSPFARPVLLLLVVILALGWFHGLVPGLAAGDLARASASPLGGLWEAHCGLVPVCVLTVGTIGRLIELGVFAMCAALLADAALAAAAVLILLVSPLGYAFVLLPAGVLSSFAVAAIDVAVAAALAIEGRMRVRAIAASALVAAACDPVLAIVAWLTVGIALRLVRPPALARADVMYVAVASVAGGLLHLAGDGAATFSTVFVDPADAGEAALRWVIAALVLTPLALFAVLREGPRARLIAAWDRLDPARRTLAVALCAAIVIAPFCADATLIAYAIESALLLIIVAPLGRLVAASSIVAPVALCVAVVLVWHGVDIRRDSTALAAVVPADAADRTLVSEALAAQPAPVAVTVVDGGDPTVRRRYGDATFFRAVAPGRVASVSYVTAVPAAVTGMVFLAGPAGLVRADREIRALQLVAADERNVHYDFVRSFDRGQISDASPQQTPSGRGVMQLPEPTPFGSAPTITVVSGFSYTFHGVAVQPGDRFVAAAGKIFAIGVAVRATVRVVDAGRTHDVVTIDVPPADAAGLVHWTAAVADLSAYAGRRVDVTFAASSPTGDATANWASFDQPVIAGR